MNLKSRLAGVVTIAGLGAIVAGCAAIGIGGEPDERWADFQTWEKVIDGQTEDPTNFIGNVHRGPTGFRNVYVNDIGLETVNSSEAGRVFPAGSILVKEQFKNEADYLAGKGAAHTVSIKTDDTTWGWADSLSSSAGASQFCSGCHLIASQHDSMFTGGGYDEK